MSLPDLLSEAQRTLLHLRRRQFSVEAIYAEVERVRAGKRFVIHDDVAWAALLDHRDMNVIALASWAKAAYSPGGLFGQLQAHHLRAFAAKRTWKADDEDPYLEKLLDENFYSKHLDLFPRGVVKPEDIGALRNLFEVASGPLLADRSENRAHPFEKGTSAVPMLGIDEMREAFEAFGQLLNDLSLVAVGTTWSVNDLNLHSQRSAELLVDVVMIPHWAHDDRARRGMRREELFHLLHEDEARNPGDPFNAKDRLKRILPRR